MYRVTIDAGPYAGRVQDGTTLEAAIDGLRRRCPGLTDADVWWSYATPDGQRHQCVTWGVYATGGRRDRALDALTCKFCRRTLTGPTARYEYVREHKHGGCLEHDVYLDEIAAERAGR
jgi:hypothetical protein